MKSAFRIAVTALALSILTGAQAQDLHYGKVSLDAFTTSGGLHRVQENGSENGISLSCESDRRLGKTDLYGRFSFTQSRIRDRQFCDNYDPFDGNPFKVGSDNAGDYTSQRFGFEVKTSTLRFSDIFIPSLDISYNVGDLSRINDPRSRSQQLEISVRPSLSWLFSAGNRLSAGISFGYAKEKMLKLSSKAENLDRYYYYEMKGAGAYSQVGIISFSRRYQLFSTGGDISFHHNGHGMEAIVKGSLSGSGTSIRGEAGESPGRYDKTTAGLSGDMIITREKTKHRISATVTARSGRATEFFQEQRIVTDARGRVDQYYETLVRTVRFKNSDIYATCSYLASLKGNPWSAGIRMDYRAEDSRYILPETEFNWGWLLPAGVLKYGIRLNKIDMAATLQGGWRIPLSSGLDISPALETEGKMLIADKVLAPDAALFSTGALYIWPEAKVSIPLRKEYARTLLLGLSGEQLHSFSAHGSRIEGRLSVGIAF